MKAILTPRELAESIGVSESSVKRWVDDGRIAAARTAGGHRRISAPAAARYIRQSGAALVRPEVLGLEGLTGIEQARAENDDRGEALFQYLRAGAAAEASGWVVGRFLAGESVAALVDGPLALAMERIGALWRESALGVFEEHRASQIALAALSRLRLLLAPPPGAPVAVGGAPSGDRYLLPSLAVAVVLEDQGWAATNLGPEMPLATLELAVEALGARLAWLSVSVSNEPELLSREIACLLPGLAQRGAQLIVGGSQLSRLELEASEALHVGGSLADLETLLQAL